MTMTEYQVTGMTCGHCETVIRKEVSQMAGIQLIDVSAETGLLVVTGHSEVDDAAVFKAVEAAGYEAVRVP